MMYTQEEKEIMNLADSYTLLYSFLAVPLLDRFKTEGERALREGTRRFGRDRAETLRSRHQKNNYKINMKSLFSVGPDLPPDPRFCRELQELNSQERVSHTLYCPMAAIWEKYGVLEIGRIYCEEFHNACYGHYGYGYTKVNLAKTLTQPEDEYCAFNVVLRPENLPEELKSLCFEEFDPVYAGPVGEIPQAYGKRGFSTLFLKLYCHITEAAIEQFGSQGRLAICQGLGDMAEDSARRLEADAREQKLPVTAEFLSRNVPIEVNLDSEPLWQDYGKDGLKEMLWESFCLPLYGKFNLTV